MTCENLHMNKKPYRKDKTDKRTNENVSSEQANPNAAHTVKGMAYVNRRI